MKNFFNIAVEELPKETLATEGLKGTIIGGLIGSLFFGIGFIPGAIIGHFWQELAEQNDKKEIKLKAEIKDLKKSVKDNKTKQAEIDKKQAEIDKHEQKMIQDKEKFIKENKDKIKSVKVKVGKEELSEEIPIVEVSETPVVTESDKDDNIERTEDIISGMESLCEIIRHIKSPTPTHIALIKVAANMAVAGTTIPATALFSANESFTDLNVTIEGIKSRIKSARKVLSEIKK